MKYDVWFTNKNIQNYIIQPLKHNVEWQNIIEWKKPEIKNYSIFFK